jgi:hypothetical protein
VTRLPHPELSFRPWERCPVVLHPGETLDIYRPVEWAAAAYVRQAYVDHRSRTSRIRSGYGGVLASTVPSIDGHRSSIGWARRVFYLADHDPYDGGPSEAVNPRLIVASTAYPTDMTEVYSPRASSYLTTANRRSLRAR